MDIFDKVLENIDESYPFSLSPKLIYGFISDNRYMLYNLWNHISYGIRERLTSSTVGNLVKLVPSLTEKDTDTKLFVAHIIRTKIF